MCRQRIAFLDYARVLACFMVIIVHSCEFFYIGDSGLEIKNRDDGLWVSVIDSAFRCAVPLFVMISAYLLVPVKESAGLFFRKRLVRVVVPFLIWSVLYATLPYLWGAMSAEDVGRSVLTLTYNFNNASGHLWFIYMLLGVYLIMPVISPWLEKVSKRDEQIFIAIWFLSTFLPYLREITGPVYGECDWNEFSLLWYYSGYIGYVVLAHYVRTYLSLSRTTEFATGTVMFAIGYFITAAVFYSRIDTAVTLTEIEVSWRFCTPNVVFESLGAFLVMKSLFGSVRKESRLVVSVSDMSYGMYLMHIFILGVVFNLVNGQFTTPVTIVLVGVSTFVICYMLTRLISLLPGSKYLVG